MSRWSSADLLTFHRDIVAIPSVSKSEAMLVEFLEKKLRAHGAAVERSGRNLFAVAGPKDAPILAFNTHIDTVPPSPAWTRPPHEVTVEDGKVYGLGSNDAKAAVAAMTATFINLMPSLDEMGIRLLLTLVCDEETGGEGTEVLLPALERRGIKPAAALIGEPTGLDLAIAQKGLLVLELESEGDVCHAAHARAMNATNAITKIARDLAQISSVSLGGDDAVLGPITCEPTVIQGGGPKNALPAKVTCILDIRTNPHPAPKEIFTYLQTIARSRVKMISQRLRPCEVSTDSAIVRAARAARPEAQMVGSRSVSDWVFFGQIPAVKVGPGRTERSHQADEFVLESEILDGHAFYTETARRFAEIMRKDKAHDATVGSR